jgi:hypothetical protein
MVAYRGEQTNALLYALGLRSDEVRLSGFAQRLTTTEYGRSGRVEVPVDGKAACTHYAVVRSARAAFGGWVTQVTLRPLTGRSHQLRQHMVALGHPMLGDSDYCPPQLLALEEAHYGLHLWAERLQLVRKVCAASRHPASMLGYVHISHPGLPSAATGAPSADGGASGRGIRADRGSFAVLRRYRRAHARRGAAGMLPTQQPLEEQCCGVVREKWRHTVPLCISESGWTNRPRWWVAYGRPAMLALSTGIRCTVRNTSALAPR